MKMIYLLPFLLCEDIEKFMEKIIPIVSLYIFLQKENAKRVNKSIERIEKIVRNLFCFNEIVSNLFKFIGN